MKIVLGKVFRGEWYRWFAWYPVIYRDKMYWLCWMRRKYDGQLGEYLYRETEG